MCQIASEPPRNSCQAVYSVTSGITERYEHYRHITTDAVTPAVLASSTSSEDTARSPIRKKPHIEIQEKQRGDPQTCVPSPDNLPEKEDQPSSSSGSGKVPLTLADCEF